MDLVVLAAGMGSRFGGLKQIKPIDNYGNFIIDFSIYDAIKVGFDKVVFVIKEENYEAFENSVAKRIRPFIKVEYAFQGPKSFLPEEYKNVVREKPWGTAHAVLCAKDKVSDCFAVINADDFYGRESLRAICNYMKQTNGKECSMVAFKAINTISENGEVKRGICNTKDDKLLFLEESAIKVENSKLFARSLNKENDLEKEIDKETLVSMNLFGFSKDVFKYIEEGFYAFLNKNKNNLQTVEFFLPTIVTELINRNIINLKVLTTDEKWLGLTYKEDFENVHNGILELKKAGIYKDNLWEK